MINYFGDFFAKFIIFALFLYVFLVLIDGVCGFRDFFKYRIPKL